MRSAAWERTQCLGGWSFLLLAMGCFVMLPSSVLTGIYVRDTSEVLRPASISLFALALLLLLVGTLMCVVWCLRSGAKNNPAAADHAPPASVAEKPTNNNDASLVDVEDDGDAEDQILCRPSYIFSTESAAMQPCASTHVQTATGPDMTLPGTIV